MAGFLLGPLIGTAAALAKEERDKRAREDAFLGEIVGHAITRGEGAIFDQPQIKAWMKKSFGQDYTEQAKWLADINKKMIETSVMGMLRDRLAGGTGVPLGTPGGGAPGGIPPSAAPFSEPNGITPGTGMIAPEILRGGMPQGVPSFTMPTSAAPQANDVASRDAIIKNAINTAASDRPSSAYIPPVTPMTMPRPPEPPMEASPVAPPITLRPSPRSMLPAGVTVSQKHPVTGENLSISGMTEPERHADELRLFLGSPGAKSMTHPQLVEGARQRGLLNVPNAMESINAISNAKYMDSFTQRLSTFRGRPTDREFGDAALQTSIDTGFVPKELFTSLYKTPEQQNVGYAETVRNAVRGNPGVPLNVIHSVALSMGFTPDAKTVQDVAGYVKNELRNTLTQDPKYANNPAAMTHQLLTQTGFVGATSEELALANQVAPLPPNVLQQAGVEGVNPPLAREAKPASVAPQIDANLGEVLSARASEREAHDARLKAEEVTKGTTLAKEEVRPETTVSRADRQHYVNPTTLASPQEGAKYKDVSGPDTKFVSFTGTPGDLRDTARLRQVTDQYRDSLETLQPVLSQGSFATKLRSAGIVGIDFKIPGTSTTINLFPGALPDETAIAAAFPGVDEKTARQYAKAMVNLKALQDTGLHILRVFLNEKGNVRGDLIQSGIRSLPSLNDNYVTATQKYKNFVDFADEWEKGFGLPGRSAWPAFKSKLREGK